MRPERESGPHVERLARASNELGFQLLSLLLDEHSGRNVLVSSFSVSLALAMAYNGAEGRVKEALARALGIGDLSLRQVNEAGAALTSLGQALGPDLTLVIANAIWVLEGLEPKPEFVERISDAYDGKFGSVDFDEPATADLINGWVADKTDDRIEQLVTAKLIEDAIMVLVNAVVFHGFWTSPFDESKTERGPSSWSAGR